jgi:type IV secretory pathway TraG/TraD family ATPase VirD4
MFWRLPLFQGLGRAAKIGIQAPIPIYHFFSGKPVWFGELIAATIALWFDGQILRYLWQGFYMESVLTLFGIILLCAPLMLLQQVLMKSNASWVRPLGWAPAFGSFSGVSVVGLSANNESSVKRGSVVEDARGKSEAASPLTITLGRVPIAKNVEPQHFLISGTTGAGKTQAVHGMLDSIRRREQPVIIADVGGVYLSKWAKGDEFVLNPFDSRDAGWNPFRELKRDYDCERLAKAAIPDVDGDAQQWNMYAQNLFGAVLTQLWKREQWSPRELVRLVMAADRAELEEWVKGTAAAPLASESNDRMLASTRSVASTYIKPWEYLPEDGEFSVREWVQEVGRGASSQWLFLTMRDDQRALLRNLVATYLDLAILEGLSLTENPNRRLWYVLDELDTLGKVGTLRDGLTKLRKYGGSIITGIQSIAQLQSTYGDKGASVLAANLNTKLLLRAGDSDTAKWCEDTIGQQEIERRERSTNEGTSVNSGGMMGSMGQSEGQGYAERRVTQSAVLASEFMSLPDLSGYVGTPSEPWRRVDVPYMQLPDVAPAFMEAP